LGRKLKLCIIGNSHVPALKLAWDGGVSQQYPDIEITFFAAPNPLLFELSIVESALVSHNRQTRESIALTSGIKPRIEPQNYDRFLICGFGTDIDDMINFERDWYSSAVVLAGLYDLWNKKPMLGILHMLQTLTDKPIFAALQPLNARKKGNDSALAAVENFLDWSRQEIFTPLNVPLIMQPKQTTTPQGSTLKKFLRDAPRLPHDRQSKGAFYKAVDHSHMNAKYGAIWLRAFFDQHLLPKT